MTTQNSRLAQDDRRGANPEVGTPAGCAVAATVTPDSHKPRNTFLAGRAVDRTHGTDLPIVPRSTLSLLSSRAGKVGRRLPQRPFPLKWSQIRPGDSRRWSGSRSANCPRAIAGCSSIPWKRQADRVRTGPPDGDPLLCLESPRPRLDGCLVAPESDLAVYWIARLRVHAGVWLWPIR